MNEKKTIYNIDTKTKKALTRLKDLLKLKTYDETLKHLLQREGMELEGLDTVRWDNFREKVRNLLEDKTYNIFTVLKLDKHTRIRATEEFLKYINQFSQYTNLLRDFQKGDMLKLLESIPDIVKTLSNKVIDYEMKVQNIKSILE